MFKKIMPTTVIGWLVVAALVLSGLLMGLLGTAYGSSVAVNPSSQMHNQGVISTYIEGVGMHDLGNRFASELKKRNVSARVFWSGYGDSIAGLIVEVRAANKYKATDFVALHSDAAATNKTNTMLILFASPAGERLGRRIGMYVSSKLGERVEYRYRPNLYVLRASNMPAVLIETLNHNNKADTLKLLDNNYRQLLAETLAEAYTGKKQPVTPVVQTKVRIPKSSGATYTTVRLGSHGADVLVLQRLLTTKAYDLGVDGLFGSQTSHVVKKFQGEHRLVIDGVVGPRTWKTLKTTKVYKTIVYGDNNRAVGVLQQRLHDKFFNDLEVDGVFGLHTNSAVRIFQRVTNLKEDGIVGYNTWQKINKQ